MSFPSFSSLFCRFFWRLDVCGKILSSINRVSLVESWFFVILYFISCLICYRWYRQSRNLEDQEPLLEQTRLEHRKVDLETRIEHLEADVLYLRSDYVFLEDGEKKDAIFFRDLRPGQ